MSGDELREAVEALANQYQRAIAANARIVASDLRRILAEHPATPDSAADDTGAGEREHAIRDDDPSNPHRGTNPDCTGTLCSACGCCMHCIPGRCGCAVTDACTDPLCGCPFPATPDADDTPPPAEPDAGEVEGLAEWLRRYLGNYTLPANYAAPLYAQTHRDVARYAAAPIAEALLESDWLAAHDQKVKAEALRKAADDMVWDFDGYVTRGAVRSWLRDIAEWIARGEAGR